MTTPAERTRTVIQARAFLIQIGQDLSLPESIRNEAWRLLRHYPSCEEVQRDGVLEESADNRTFRPPVLGSITGAKMQENPWQAWFDSEGVSEDASAILDQPLERLKGSVRDYVQPFQPAGSEDWKAQHNAAISAAAMRTIPNIAAVWGLSNIDMAALLGVSMETYRAWSQDPSLAVFDPEQRERGSLLLGIYKALVILFPPPDRQRRWLHQPNQGAPFQGDTPINCMRYGGLKGLQVVRRHLDAASQGGCLD